MYRKYGDGTEALGVLHADLAELHFQDQEYEEACAQAKVRLQGLILVHVCMCLAQQVVFVCRCIWQR